MGVSCFLSHPDIHTHSRPQTYYFDPPREAKRRREPRLAQENHALPLLEPGEPILSSLSKQQKEKDEGETKPAGPAAEEAQCT